GAERQTADGDPSGKRAPLDDASGFHEQTSWATFGNRQGECVRYGPYGAPIAPSPPALEPMAPQMPYGLGPAVTSGSPMLPVLTPSLMNRTEPSTISPLTPPG